MARLPGHTPPVYREDKDPERRSDRDGESKIGMVQDATKAREMMPTLWNGVPMLRPSGDEDKD